ncbi:MAG: arylsulfatase [Gammaproteobacteria bacterium]|nr:arylsulfatase [Gammaproteobacteria bacterium]
MHCVNRRRLLKFSAALLALLTAVTSGAADTQRQRPNILLIVADDLGYTDIGAFGGGDIHTPTLNQLAREGIVFSRFYAGAQCSTTRAMLLGGVDNHRAGLGTTVGAYSQPAPNQLGQPGYEGELRDDVITLSSILQQAGYYTFMVGKWHLGASDGNRPSSRGFDRTFAIQQNSDHFDDQLGSFGFGHRDYWRNGEVVEKLPQDFYSSRGFTDEFIDQLEQRDAGTPFFGYLAYTAPHYPLQAPDDIIDKYKGRYDSGYDQLRRQRAQGLFESGLIPADPAYRHERADIRPWESLSAEEQAKSARAMEIYAAMVDDMDQNIARVLTYLKDKGLYDNTLIVFLSDNGAEAASELRGHAPALLPKASNLDNSLQNMGRRNSVVLYSHTWAAASGGVFHEYKFSGAEGGVRVPAIMSWPHRITRPRMNPAITSVLDIMPTVLELAGLRHPAELNPQVPYQKPIGKSLTPILLDQAERVRSQADYLGFEFWSGRGLVAGDWKLTGLYNQDRSALEPWQLFNLANDPGEQRDLSAREPEIMQKMLGYWQEYVNNNGVIIAEPEVPALRKPQNTTAKQGH